MLRESDCVLGVVTAVELDKNEVDEVWEVHDGVVAALDESDDVWLCRRAPVEICRP